MNPPVRSWFPAMVPICPQDTAFPDWDGLFDVIAPGGEEHQRASSGLHPPLDMWRWQDGNGDNPRWARLPEHLLAWLGRPSCIQDRPVASDGNYLFRYEDVPIQNSN